MLKSLGRFLSVCLSATLIQNQIAAANPVKQSQLIRENQAPNKLVASHSRMINPGRYLIVLENSASFNGFVELIGSKIGYTYENVFNGFSAELDDRQLKLLESDSRVKAIFHSSKVKLYGTQESATWGIDRCDQESSVLDRSYSWIHDGKGVTAYIVDTGIFAAHPDFGGRAVALKDVTSDRGTKYENIDGHGHGTHVAGTIGSMSYGIAKAVSLVGIKVFDRKGSEATDETVLAGIDEAIKHHKANKTLAVMNLSLGGEASEVLDLGVKKAIEAGITVVVAAGNDSKDACNDSPARLPEAVTVAAISKGDKISFFSNYGKCVDIMAPGSGITSLKPAAGGSATMSGTSMASPHVAGIAALILSANPQFQPTDVSEYLIETSIKDVAKIRSTTPNRIAATIWNRPVTK